LLPQRVLFSGFLTPPILKENRKAQVCIPLPFDNGAAVVGREFSAQIKCEEQLRKKGDGIPLLGPALGAAEMGTSPRRILTRGTAGMRGRIRGE
jgi:hypothetical protein